MGNHKWDTDKEPGWAHCTNCFMRVKAYRVKRGGLDPCNPPPEPPPPIPTCLATELQPVVACFNCEGRLDDKLCNKMKEFYIEHRQISNKS